MTRSTADIEMYVRELLTVVRNEARLPGLALSLSVDGSSFSDYEGFLTADQRTPFSLMARFQLGCITKMLTSLAASALIHSKQLDPAAPINAYLTELNDCPLSHTLTINHLMSHTSGYQGLPLGDPGVSYYYTWDKFKEFFKATSAFFLPGTVFNYEHTELVILGEIIRRVVGLDVHHILHEQVFDPLKLSVGYLNNDKGTSDLLVGDHVWDRVKQVFTRVKSLPFGSFWSASLSSMTLSMCDLVKLGVAFIDLLDRRIATLSPMLSPEPISHMLTQVVPLPHTEGMGAPEQFPHTFGHGVADYGGPLFGHNGSARGQTCGIRFDLKHRVVLAVGLNVWQPHLRDRLINKLLTAVVGRLRCPERHPEPLSVTNSELTGRYVGARGLDIIVTETDPGLKASIGSQGHSQRFDILLTRDARGALKPISNTMHHTIGFFKPPGDSTVAIMLGLFAFKKQ